MTKIKCSECGEESSPPEQYCNCPEKAVMQVKAICFSCAFWHGLARVGAAKELVIAGRVYSIGPEPRDPRNYKGGLGFGGRKFEIEFNDGRRVVTHNLWAGSQVPERWRADFPDTARFLGGAKEVQVGHITCWEDSE